MIRAREHEIQKSRPIVYISGKYTDAKLEDRMKNVEKAKDMAKMVWKSGGAAICPHLNTMEFDVDSDSLLDGYFEVITRCDAVMFLDNFQDSEGAKAELWQAESYGVPTFFSFEDLEEFIDENIVSLESLE